MHQSILQESSQVLIKSASVPGAACSALFSIFRNGLVLSSDLPQIMQSFLYLLALTSSYFYGTDSVLKTSLDGLQL